MRHDAVEVLRDMLPPAGLAGVYLFFPDRGTRSATTSGGSLLRPSSTSWRGSSSRAVSSMRRPTGRTMPEQMMDVLSASAAFRQPGRNGATFTQRPDERPLTKFERADNARSRRLGPGLRPSG